MVTTFLFSHALVLDPASLSTILAKLFVCCCFLFCYSILYLLIPPPCVSSNFFSVLSAKFIACLLNSILEGFPQILCINIDQLPNSLLKLHSCLSVFQLPHSPPHTLFFSLTIFFSFLVKFVNHAIKQIFDLYSCIMLT